MHLRTSHYAALLVVGSLLTSESSAQDSASKSLGPAWKKFENCSVLVEYSADVAAAESGLLKSLQVERNEWVIQGAALGKLDPDLTEMELEIAQLQYELAQRLASDDSDLQFHRYALKEAEQDLENHRSIQNRVSGSEIRQLELQVAKDKVAVIRAQQALQRAVVDSQLKAANVRASKIRLSHRTIQAPIQGSVTRIDKRPGQWVEKGETILRLEDLEHLMVDQLIPLEQFNRAWIKGSDVVVEAEWHQGQTTRLKGTVVSYDPQVTAQGNIRVHARVLNRRQQGEWVLLPGAKVTMYIAVQPENFDSQRFETHLPDFK